jgi:ATP-dependent Clp protease ATP-binding subunit ClpC
VLDRFSAQAQLAVDSAEEEARRMGHHHVGSEHLLLGIMHVVECPEARALRAAGASLDGARQKVDEAVGTKLDSHVGEPEFTARARRALERASRFSLQRLDSQVGTEHVLLGVLDVEGTACQVLRGLGVDVGNLRRTIDTAPQEVAVTAVAAEVAAAAAIAPRCLGCGEDLVGGLSYRTIAATDITGAVRNVMIVYCSACGTTFGAL